MGGVWPFLALVLLSTVVSGAQLVRQFSGEDSFVHKRQNVTIYGSSFVPQMRPGPPIIDSLRLLGILYMTYQCLFIGASVIRVYINHSLGSEVNDDFEILNITKNTQKEKEHRHQRRRQQKKLSKKPKRKPMKLQTTQEDAETVEVEPTAGTITGREPTDEEQSARAERTELTQLTIDGSDAARRTSTITKKPSMNNRSSKLPRAKKGNQTDFLERMEDFMLNETEEDRSKDGGEERRKSAEKNKKTENGSKTDSSKKKKEDLLSPAKTQDSERERTASKKADDAQLTADPPKCPITQNGGVSKHKLKNIGTTRVVFKVKPSSPNKNSAKPAFGFVDAKDQTDIEISRIAESEKGDKITVYFKTADIGATDAKTAFEKPGSSKSITIMMEAD